MHTLGIESIDYSSDFSQLFKKKPVISENDFRQTFHFQVILRRDQKISSGLWSNRSKDECYFYTNYLILVDFFTACADSRSKQISTFVLNHDSL